MTKNVNRQIAKDEQVKNLRIAVRKDACLRLEELRKHEVMLGYKMVKKEIEICQQIIVDMDYLLSGMKQ